MGSPLPQPRRIDWEEHVNDELGQHFVGIPTVDDDAFEQEEVRAHADGFTASLGSFTTTGDASSFEEAKRFGEAAFRALVELNNVISHPRSSLDISKLSPREVDVVSMLRSGKRLTAIARELGISQHTVRNFLKHAFRKLGVHSQVELLARIGGHHG